MTTNIENSPRADVVRSSIHEAIRSTMDQLDRLKQDLNTYRAECVKAAKFRKVGESVNGGCDHNYEVIINGTVIGRVHKHTEAWTVTWSISRSTPEGRNHYGYGLRSRLAAVTALVQSVV